MFPMLVTGVEKIKMKEISGTTVNDHITSLLYKEICNLLKQSDMTMGEIADYLHFNDQSALTNFFINFRPIFVKN